MVWYEVHGYTTTEDSSDIETEYIGQSLKKAYSVFEKMKLRYARVRIDKWDGRKVDGSFDGDYIDDVENWVKQ